MSKKKRKSRKHRPIHAFHMRCVKFIKKRSNGYIHPDDTSWDGLAYAFECLTNTNHVQTKFYERCVELSSQFQITAPSFTLSVPSKDNKRRFYNSAAWKKLRYATIVKYGGKCMACKRSDVSLHVDHIKPVSKYWDLRLDPDNTQVLCDACNEGKSNVDETDWR